LLQILFNGYANFNVTTPATAKLIQIIQATARSQRTRSFHQWPSPGLGSAWWLPVISGSY